MSDKTQSDVVAVDTKLGGDADSGGIAQPVSRDEIDDILNNPAMAIEERRARLDQLRQRVGGRENVDRGNEMSMLALQVDEALAMLADGGHTYGTLEGVGMDPSSRADARSADDDESLVAPDAAGTREPR